MRVRRNIFRRGRDKTHGFTLIEILLAMAHVQLGRELRTGQRVLLLGVDPADELVLQR